MDNDIPLPSPPRSRARDARTAIVHNARKLSYSTRTQKLSLERLGGTPSSDPPLFSSDDFQSSALENYYYTPSRAQDDAAQEDAESQQQQQRSRKRRYRGTWWGEHLHTNKKRTDFRDKRQFDSGVWMGSEDLTDPPASSDDAPVLAGETGEGIRNCWADGKQVGDPAAITGGISRNHPQILLPRPVEHDENGLRPARLDRPVESEPHARARAVITRCLEDGDDNVDLS